MTDFILNINKPPGFTSHDVVAKLRGILKIKKIGHCGTLDPMATGVLPVCVGKATKAVEFIMGQDKEYIAKLKLGFVSDTQDSTGSVTALEHENPAPEKVKEVLNAFRGKIYQTPPMYSAIKQNGVKLYKLARKGIEIERKKRETTINYIDLLDYDDKNQEYTIRVGCLKGTYIRTLCHDIGLKLNSGAVMTSLVRTKSGIFDLDNTVTLKEVENNNFSKGVYKIDDVFLNYPKIFVNNSLQRLIKNGVKLGLSQIDINDKTKEAYRVYNDNNELLMLACIKDNSLEMIKSFY